MEKYIAFDVGGTKIKHSLIQTNGEILTKSEYSTERESLDKFLEEMIKTINSYSNHHKVQGIAISLPGYVDIYSGFSETAGAVKALANQNLKLLLEEHVHLPVEIENDGNCAAIAEAVSGNAQDCDDFICMTIGTGIGGGIFLNGSIYRGHQHRAGEYGMMNIAFSGQKRKNMHETGSMTALLKQYKAYKNIQGTVEGQEIFEDAKKDPEVKSLLDQWIGYISRGIYNLVVTLNPEKFLIGGGVSTQNYLFEEVNRQLEDYELWKFFNLPIVPCKYRNDAGMLGAVYHFINMQRYKNSL